MTFCPHCGKALPARRKKTASAMLQETEWARIEGTVMATGQKALLVKWHDGTAEREQWLPLSQFKVIPPRILKGEPITAEVRAWCVKTRLKAQEPIA